MHQLSHLDCLFQRVFPAKCGAGSGLHGYGYCYWGSYSGGPIRSLWLCIWGVAAGGRLASRIQLDVEVGFLVLPVQKQIASESLGLLLVAALGASPAKVLELDLDIGSLFHVMLLVAATH